MPDANETAPYSLAKSISCPLLEHFCARFLSTSQRADFYSDRARTVSAAPCNIDPVSHDSFIVAELDHVAVRVAHIEAGTLTPSPEQPSGSADDVEHTRAGKRLEVGRFDHQADVINVLSGSFGLEKIDDRALVESHGREQHLAAPPLIDPDTFEAELTAIPLETALDVGDVEHDVIESNRFHHPRNLTSRKSEETLADDWQPASAPAPEAAPTGASQARSFTDMGVTLPNG
jgi:hypothetical protein